MNLDQVMTRDPKCCAPTAPLQEVARAMRDLDVGEIPVVDQDNKPLGVVTDRDIAVRVVADGRNPADVCARDCMTSPAVTIHEASTLEDCAHLMERERIRRVPVVDRRGAICGIVALADLERTNARSLKTEVTAAVSQPH